MALPDELVAEKRRRLEEIDAQLRELDKVRHWLAAHQWQEDYLAEERQEIVAYLKRYDDTSETSRERGSSGTLR